MNMLQALNHIFIKILNVIQLWIDNNFFFKKTGNRGHLSDIGSKIEKKNTTNQTGKYK